MRKELIILLAITAILCLLPIALHGNNILTHLLVLCLIWAVVASAWDLIMGYAGIFTFGQIAFLAIGAYASAILTMRLGVSPWIGIPFGGIVTAVFGILIGLPCLRLKGDYVALLTFAIQLLLGPFIISDAGKALGTGGTQGLVNIPALSVGGYTFTHMTLTPWFYVAILLFFISMYIMYRIVFSPWGMAFVALRENENFAKSLGVSDFRYKMLVFAVSAFLTGMIGAFYAHYTGVLSVRLVNGLDLFLLLMVMQVVGGMGMFPGSIIGAFIVTFVNEGLRVAEVYRPMFFGTVIILFILFVPRGILGTIFPKGGNRVLERFSHSIRQRAVKLTNRNDNESIKRNY